MMLHRRLCSVTVSRAASVQIQRGGIGLGDETHALHAACVHYFDLERGDWRACLERVRAIGFRFVDIPIPWRHHERRAGELALSSERGKHDLVGFLKLVHELGLFAVLRPGPTLNAELTGYGLPDRIVWDRACQARSHRDNPVMVPGLVRMFPLPSYGSDAFRDEVRQYLGALAEALSSLLYPQGPIVMVQLDHGALMTQRCGPYEQDYHPDSIRRYRAHLRQQYGRIEALSEAYGTLEGADEGHRFTGIEPPRRFDARTPEDLLRHLDWVGFQEALVGDAYRAFSGALRDGGFEGCLLSAQLPAGADRTAVTAAALGGAVDLVGVTVGGAASESNRVNLARLCGGLAVRSMSGDIPPYAAEMASGFTPLSSPRDGQDTMFSAMTALAYGVRGFNLHMAVERNRFIGAPIGAHGDLEAGADTWKKLNAALDRVKFRTLRRELPVRIVMPAMARRLMRVMDALGSAAPVSPFGQGARARCLENDFGLGHRVAIDADTFALSFEQALDARGVPYARVAGEECPQALDAAAWIICPTAGPMGKEVRQQLSEAHEAGARLTLGPIPNILDERFRSIAAGKVFGPRAESLDKIDPASADAAVARAIEQLELPSYACDPDTVHATVHIDEANEIQVVFVINSGPSDVAARTTIGVDAQWEDAMDQSTTRSEEGVLEAHLRARSVRMLIRREA